MYISIYIASRKMFRSYDSWFLNNLGLKINLWGYFFQIIPYSLPLNYYVHHFVWGSKKQLFFKNSNWPLNIKKNCSTNRPNISLLELLFMFSDNLLRFENMNTKIKWKLFVLYIYIFFIIKWFKKKVIKKLEALSSTCELHFLVKYKIV